MVMMKEQRSLEGDILNSQIGRTLADCDQRIEEDIVLTQFFSGIRTLVEGKAKEKGYNESGASGNNPLMDFTEKFFRGHAAGEVVYKMVRYEARGNEEDLLKAAAWCYLLFKQKRTKAYPNERD